MYAYLFYPILVGVISAIKKTFSAKKNDNQNKNFYPTISIIIPAFNESKFIIQKIENTLQLDYPKQLLQIIVVADGCVDDTVDLAKSYAAVQVIANEKRLGKSAAINLAMQHATNDITVFTDANTLLNKACLQHIVPHFLHPKVGGVACEKKIGQSDDEHVVTQMEGLYWKYESLIKQWESSIHSVIGAAGELFCIKTSLFTSLDEKIILDDFILSSSILKNDYTIAYEKKSFALEPATYNLYEEAKRKIRIGAGAAQTLQKIGLKPYSNWWLNFQFLSRRVIRWAISPIALIILFFTNFYIVKQGASQNYSTMFFLQLCFYLLAVIGMFLHWIKQTNKLALTPFYFIFMNLCMILGWIKYMFNLQNVQWQKARRLE
jgi:poly-beta-1,6-N-acetyl-D-glucosamine synthase